MVGRNNRLMCQEAGKRWGVSPATHSKDFIFRYPLDNPAFSSKKSAVSYYFDDGARSAQKLHRILTETCGLDEKPLRLLEFASGYGCVTRHLKNTVPFSSTVACDIHPEAIAFITEQLETEAVLSSSQPEGLQLSSEYDAVFALSFFSHMPKTTCARWLRALASFLRPGGHLIFTTHGLISQQMLLRNCSLDGDGFFFQPGSEQKDLGAQEYGTAITSPQYVLSRLYEIPGFRLKAFQEGFWWSHQDLFVVRVTDSI
jgi:SAM-dependent methyltransferase